MKTFGHLLSSVVAIAAIAPVNLVLAQSVDAVATDFIEEIVVTATRGEKPLLKTPASITVQSTKELREKGFVVGTDEFRGVPGVFFRRNEGDNEEFPSIAIRGVTGNHGNDTFLALVDGVPFVGPDEEVLLYEIPYAAVDTIEIVRGPVSALYGRGGIAGAVNYRTRPITADRAEIAVSAGNEGFARIDAHLDRSFDNGAGFSLNATHEEFDGWREQSERELTSFFLKGTIPIGKRSTLNGYLTYFERKAEIPGAIPTLADGTIVDVIGGDETFLGWLPTHNDIDGLIGALKFEHTVNDTLTLQFTGQARQFDSDASLNFFDRFLFDPDNSIMGVNGFASVNDAEVVFGEATALWNTGRHSIVAGLSAERTELDEQDYWSGENDPFFSGVCFFQFYAIYIDYSTGEVINDSPDNDCFVRRELDLDGDTTNEFYGAFIQDEIALSEDWTLTLGLRYDEFERKTDFSVLSSAPVNASASDDEDAFSPKASLSYNYGNGMLYGAYGRGFNSNFGPIWQWDPTRYARGTKPTTVDSYEFGWKGRSSNGQLEWETAVFFLKQEDRLIFISNPDPTGPPSLASTGQEYSSQGLEAALRFRPTERTNGVLTYTYVDPEWDELIIAGSFGAPDQDFSGVTPTGVPEHMIYVELEHKFTNWLTARLTYEWYDDYYVDLSNSVKTGNYDLLGLSATFTLPSNENISVDVSVTNLLDEEYYFFFGGSSTAVTYVSPGVPRLARATLRWRL